MSISAARDKLPKYSELFGPIIESLRRHGGSARPIEVRDDLSTRLEIPDEALELTKKNGEQLFMNRIQWGRFYLVRTGFIDSSKRGVWSLTKKANQTPITEDIADEIVKTVAGQSKENKQTDGLNGTPLENEVSPEEHETSYRDVILNRLYELSPSAFEKLCQRLLRESGFERVEVTGKTGDGGIDGNGVLQLNPFMSFKVLFQCKRYKSTVGAPVIRDFRGAMLGRADKGIIITTGSFTNEAVREAVRDGVPPIELVDGEALIDLFESLELGLTPRQVYEVDEAFFSSFE